MIRLGRKTIALGELRRIVREGAPISLDPECEAGIAASAAAVERILASGQPAYGINTGFGRLSQTRIPREELRQLQTNIVLSHAAGTGPLLDDETVRLIVALKVASLARGHSGVRPVLIERLLGLYAAGIWPCIPAKGSVGASGDLAPLAHLALTLMGMGEARLNGKILSSMDALRAAKLEPIELAPKEGLALLNGTQVSNALGLMGLFAAEEVFAAALVAGALSVDAAAGSDTPFDARIHALRGHAGQIDTAQHYARLLQGSAIRQSHRENDPRVQDPYSLRCQPQVMGACLDQLRYAAKVLEREAAAVTCGTMKPELTPPCSTRNGGSPDSVVSMRSAMRRSDRAPVSAIATASASAASATGSAWKFPPERISPSMMSGLSVTAAASRSSTLAA